MGFPPITTTKCNDLNLLYLAKTSVGNLSEFFVYSELHDYRCVFPFPSPSPLASAITAVVSRRRRDADVSAVVGAQVI